MARAMDVRGCGARWPPVPDRHPAPGRSRNARSAVEDPASVPHALNLTLDATCQPKIERLYARLLRLEVPEQDLVTQYGPCVTLLVLADRVQPRTIRTLLEWKLSTLAALPVTFAEPCVVPGMSPTLSLRVVVTEALLELHNALYNELPEEEVHIHYRPAYWQPLLKLSNVRDGHAGDRLAVALAAKWQPISGTLDGLEVMQYPPVQSIWQAMLRAGHRPDA